MNELNSTQKKVLEIFAKSSLSLKNISLASQTNI